MRHIDAGCDYWNRNAGLFQRRGKNIAILQTAGLAFIYI